jgi:bla regulator protein BlaR1
MIPASSAPIVSHLWQSTLFAAVAGLLTVVLRRNQARVRYWVWLAASYKFLIPFSWLVSVGRLVQWRAAPPIVSPTFSAVTGVVSGPTFLTALPATTSTTDRFIVPLFTIWAVWFCGFVIVAAGWFREWLRIRALVRAASPLPLGLPIGVVSTPARLEPGAFGIFHPVLLLPEGIATHLTPDQLQAVIAHELCHVRRRDNLAAAVHMLVEVLFWFHPLVWWLGKRIVDERERACDEEVVKTGSHAQAYAESILKVCEFYLGSSLTCLSGVSGSDLKKRIQRIMKSHLGVALSPRKKLLLATMGIAALAVPLMAGVLVAPLLRAQTAVSDWQTAAGGAAKFDVASVKQTGPDGSYYSNFPLNAWSAFARTGGLFTATNIALKDYLTFAYKLSTYETRHTLPPQLPKWANANRYDIQARASGEPTKDQFRLMIQALLTERFKLVAHRETRQIPVFALVLEKPGKLGPKLRPHLDNPPCAIVPAPGSPQAGPYFVGGFPTFCGGVTGEVVSGHDHFGGRNLTMDIIADILGAGWEDPGRPVVDETGLTGKFDFSIEYTPQVNGPPQGVQFDLNGPTYIEALKEQLGLKLESRVAPVDILVIDHIEEPSAN